MQFGELFLSIQLSSSRAGVPALCHQFASETLSQDANAKEMPRLGRSASI